MDPLPPLPSPPPVPPDPSPDPADEPDAPLLPPEGAAPVTGGWAAPSEGPAPWTPAGPPVAAPPAPAYPWEPAASSWPPAPPAPVYPGYGAPMPPGASGWPAPPSATAGPERISWMGFGGEVPRWGMPDILIGLGCWLLLQILVAIPVIAITKDETIISIVSLLGGWIGMVGYLVLISHRKGLRSLRRDFGWDFRWVDPLIGLGLGILTIIISGIVRVIVAQLFSEPAGTNAERIFGGAENNHALLLVLAVMAAIGAPIVEELFFRGLALRAIDRRFGTVAGIIGSSMVFAVLHWQPGSFGSTVSLVCGILIYGLVFGTATRYFKRLGPSTFAHMTINTLASAFLLYSVFSGNPIGG